MKYVQDRALAADYIEFTRSQEGQQILENHGFTSVHSARGLDLIERFGVKRCVIIVRHLQPVELKLVLVYLGNKPLRI